MQRCTNSSLHTLVYWATQRSRLKLAWANDRLIRFKMTKLDQKIEHSEMWHQTSHWSCRHFQTYCFNILDFAGCFCLVVFTTTWHLCRCLSFRVRPPCQLHNSRSQQCEWNLLWKPALETSKAKAKWEKSRMISDVKLKVPKQILYCSVQLSIWLWALPA